MSDSRPSFGDPSLRYKAGPHGLLQRDHGPAPSRPATGPVAHPRPWTVRETVQVSAILALIAPLVLLARALASPSSSLATEQWHYEYLAWTVCAGVAGATAFNLLYSAAFASQSPRLAAKLALCAAAAAFISILPLLQVITDTTVRMTAVATTVDAYTTMTDLLRNVPPDDDRWQQARNYANARLSHPGYRAPLSN